MTSSAAVARRVEQTVPRELVHKRALGEVLLTGSAALDDGRFLVSAELPRMHRLFSPDARGRYDVVALAEVVRQATILVGHRHLSVPADRRFVLGSLRLDLDRPVEDGKGPPEVAIEIEPRDLRYVDEGLARYALDGSIYAHGGRVGSGSGACLCLTGESYATLRRAGACPPGSAPAYVPATRAKASLVGRGDARDVVVTALRRDIDGHVRAGVVVDERHPCFFDHPLDHVPGALLLEACRQVALQLAAGGIVTAVTASFIRFGAIDGAVDVVCDEAAGGALEMRVEQGQTTIAKASMRVEPAREAKGAYGQSASARSSGDDGTGG